MKKKKYTLLYEDDDFVAIDKSATLLSLPDRWDLEIPNALTYMKSRFENIYMVHRLDKDTSGVMLFAKNEKAHTHVCQLFESREITKEYIGIVEGNMTDTEGTIEQSLQNIAGGKGKQQIHPDGKSSVTDYKVSTRFRGYDLVNFYPKTGRTHQIRVHAAYLGTPLLADKLYGYSKEFKVSTIKKKKYKTKKFEIERPLLTRHALHAKAISFKDLNGKTIKVESENPKDLRATIHQMQKLIPAIIPD